MILFGKLLHPLVLFPTFPPPTFESLATKDVLTIAEPEPDMLIRLIMRMKRRRSGFASEIDRTCRSIWRDYGIFTGEPGMES
jgi:hypothetical protein